MVALEKSLILHVTAVKIAQFETTVLSPCHARKSASLQIYYFLLDFKQSLAAMIPRLCIAVFQ